MSYVTKGFDNEVVRLLKSGAVGFMPSDTIYGLSGRALNQETVERIYKLKGRKSAKPLIILISDIKMLNKLSIEAGELTLAGKYWPGPLTIVLDAQNSPIWLTRGSDSLAIRMPDKLELLTLINQTGPLISTSANPEGQSPASSTMEAKKYFGDKLNFYVDAGKMSGTPSTIAKLKDGKLKILREGAVRVN